MEIEIKRVKWRDSCVLRDQQTIDADFDVAIMESVGFLIQEDKKKLVLAGELLENGNARRIIVIPKENIIMQVGLTNSISPKVKAKKVVTK